VFGCLFLCFFFEDGPRHHPQAGCVSSCRRSGGPFLDSHKPADNPQRTSYSQSRVFLHAVVEVAVPGVRREGRCLKNHPGQGGGAPVIPSTREV
jgi:hypothetical protein